MLELTIQRSILLAPDAVARVAAGLAGEIEERWLLNQPRRVRRSYADAVLGADDPCAREIWMLRAPGPVRESYIRDVLQRDPARPGADRRS